MKLLRELLRESRPEVVGGLIVQAIVVAASYLFRGEGVWISLLILAVGSAWLASAYISFGRRARFVKKGRDRERVKILVWRYPQYRSYSLTSLTLITLGLLAWLGYGYYQRTSPPEDVLILVADFDGPEPDRYRVTDTITARLKRALDVYDDVRIEPLGEIISEVDGSETARSIARQRKASIILWGWYGITEQAVPLSVHFELLLSEEAERLRHLEFGPDLDGTVAIKDVEDLESFSLQTDLSADLTLLTLYTVGVVRYSASDYDGAIASFKQALSQQGESIPANQLSVINRAIGDAYNDKGDPASAIPYYFVSLESDPEWAVVWHNLSFAFNQLGQPQQAIPFAEIAIRLEPNKSLYYPNIARSHFLLGNFQEAKEYYDTAITLDPSEATNFANRGALNAKLGDLQAAKEDYQTALGLTDNYQLKQIIKRNLREIEQAAKKN